MTTITNELIENTTTVETQHFRRYRVTGATMEHWVTICVPDCECTEHPFIEPMEIFVSERTRQVDMKDQESLKSVGIGGHIRLMGSPHPMEGMHALTRFTEVPTSEIDRPLDQVPAWVTALIEA